jgi:hypothetical protein
MSKTGEASYILMYVSSGTFPSLQRRGGRDIKKMLRKPPLRGADGVVAYEAGRGVSDHPVCAISVASRHFYYWRSHPSFARRGISSSRLLSQSTLALLTVVVFILLVPHLHAQGRRGQPVQAPKTAAPIDLTGYWVSVITEDWRVRMVTPKKGNYESVPLTPEGRRVADTWDPAKDEAAGTQCKAYGAPGVLRIPGRLHITWENDNTLRMDTDAGTQTRLFHFAGPEVQPPAVEKSWQGYSTAQWEFADAPRGQARKGNLKAVTTRLRAGYLRKNGVPFSENAVLTEYFDRITTPNGEQWLIVTAIVDDPLYVNPAFVVSTNFKQEPDGSKWNPTPCSAR